MKFKMSHLAVTISAIAMSAAITAMPPAMAQSIDLAKEQVAAVLRANPELVLEALQAAQANQQKAQADQLLKSAKPVSQAIINGDAQVAFVGAANGTPIVEYFDYNCGYCKRFHTETAHPLVAEGKTKLILVHTPIMGPGSERMAEFAAAANLQGKFGPAHSFLMQKSSKSVEEANAFMAELVTAAGLDKAKFDKALADKSAKNQVNHNTELSRKAGVTGTPMIFANNQAIPGAIPLDALKRVLAN